MFEDVLMIVASNKLLVPFKLQYLKSSLKQNVIVTRRAKRTIFNRTALIPSFIIHPPDFHHAQCLRMKSVVFGA